MENKKIIELLEKERKTVKSQWQKGVIDSAIDLLEIYEEDITQKNITSLVSGDHTYIDYNDCSRFSWGGGLLICDKDIAKRFSNKTELKLTKNGQKQPNKKEQWLDVQARGIFQALLKINRLLTD